MSDARELAVQLDAIARDSAGLVAGLDDQCGQWRATVTSWSVAECLEHLAVSNRAYLGPMQDAARGSLTRRRFSLWPGLPGILGSWFARSMEPPARAPFKAKAPSAIRPSRDSNIHQAFEGFMASHHQVAAFARENANLDLNAVSFPNPFIRGLRFSVASGLYIIAAHERRHLWQAWKTRRSAEAALSHVPSDGPPARSLP